MVEPIRIKDQFSLISGTKSIQDDTNIVADDDDGGDDSDIADPDDDEEDPDDPEAVGDYEVCVMSTYLREKIYCPWRLLNKIVSVPSSILNLKIILTTVSFNYSPNLLFNITQFVVSSF